MAMFSRVNTPLPSVPTISFLPRQGGMVSEQQKFDRKKELNERPDLSAAPLLIQRKMAVGTPHDRYEQEAEWVAERVMSMSDSTIQLEPT